MGHFVLPLLAAVVCLLLYGCALHRHEGVSETELWRRIQQQQPAWHLHTGGADMVPVRHARR